jgi:type I restriction enzyme, S subunit
MKEGWDKRRLGDLCEKITDGSHAPPKGVAFSEYLMLSSKNIFDDLITTNTPRFLSRTDFENENRRTQIKTGDVLLTIVGTIGRAAVVSSDIGRITLQRSVAVLRVKNEVVSPRFLMYSLQNMVGDIQKEAHGVAQKGLYLNQLNDLEIPIPPLDEQERIIAKLDEAFAAIDQAKINTEKSLVSLKELIITLLENIDGDQITLKNLVEIRTGKLDANAAQKNGKYPFFTCSKEVFSINTFAFDCEAILLAGNNAVGNFNVKHYKGKFNAYQRTYVITVKDENRVNYRFLFYEIQNRLKDFKNKAVGANTRFLKLGIINDMTIPLPTLTDQLIIVNRLDKILDETNTIEMNFQKKIEKLDELKKSILQKAFNGEL